MSLLVGQRPLSGILSPRVAPFGPFRESKAHRNIQTGSHPDFPERLVKQLGIEEDQGVQRLVLGGSRDLEPHRESGKIFAPEFQSSYWPTTRERIGNALLDNTFGQTYKQPNVQ